MGRGTNYSVNVPLAEGMDDESYHFMFEPIMQQVGRGVLALLSALGLFLLWLAVCQTMQQHWQNPSCLAC